MIGEATSTDREGQKPEVNRVTTIHIVDDDPDIRDAMRASLEESWKSNQEPRTGNATVQIRSDWKFAWLLARSPDLHRGDIAVCDLYPSGYWDDVPKPTVHAKVGSNPDDPRNLYKATLDLIERFLRRIVDNRAHLVVLTYVPRFIEKEIKYEGEPPLAQHIRDLLAEEKFDWYEKLDRSAQPYNFTEVTARVNEILPTSSGETR